VRFLPACFQHLQLFCSLAGRFLIWNGLVRTSARSNVIVHKSKVQSSIQCQGTLQELESMMNFVVVKCNVRSTFDLIVVAQALLVRKRSIYCRTERDLQLALK
jgi:hypothetical protein